MMTGPLAPVGRVTGNYYFDAGTGFWLQIGGYN